MELVEGIKRLGATYQNLLPPLDPLFHILVEAPIVVGTQGG